MSARSTANGRGWSSQRGGKRHHRGNGQEIRWKLEQALNGQWTALLHDLWTRDLPTPRRARRAPTDAQIAKDIAAFIADGAQTKALARVTAEEKVAADDVATSALPALYPAGQLPAPPPTLEPDGPDYESIVDEIVRCMAKPPRRSAADIFGWRYEFLAPLSDHPDAARALACAVADVALGHAGEGTLNEFLRARLIPFLKPNGGVRPIAIGTIFRRVLCRALCAHFGPAVREAVGDGQFALQECGAELIHKVVFSHMAKHPEHVTFAVDVSNAFGSLDRAEALKEAGCINGLTRWIHLLYAASPVHTFVDSKGLSHHHKVTRGMDQGCPWSSMGVRAHASAR